eukprot:GHRR01016692.1.p1 GENE.GHRR01016692.1~~GHRR01016692.1.p1  ORF type:complete len:236 (+),score=63.01 GHRR01016692.1:755-1462(+)
MMQFQHCPVQAHRTTSQRGLHSCHRRFARLVRPSARPMSVAASKDAELSKSGVGRRNVALAAAVSGLLQQLLTTQQVEAISGNPLGFKKELTKRRRKIPESEYSAGPEGLKYYDITTGGGPEARVGQRVAVHIDVKFRNVTFMTSRQGLGVTGGNPIGFDVGQPAGSPGSTLPGIDLGVRGMHVGGQRRLLVPPNLGYGDRGLGEIPGGATLEVDVELLSIKTSPLGYRTKVIEG